ncbi:hypothetical protein N9P55_01480 [bacterium]|nr:hypothetical protein [bacterium]
MKDKYRKRLTNLFYSLRQRGNRVFLKEEFINWYSMQESFGCHYCGIKAEEQRKLIELGILTSKRFFISSSHQKKRGSSRGRFLEVDRKVPDGDYSSDNCVLCCYFCNNDKSGFCRINYFSNVFH